MTHPESESLALLPLSDARARLGDAFGRFVLLRPPYAAVGLGTLRVLRVCVRDGRTDVVAGYDGYARLPGVLEARSA